MAAMAAVGAAAAAAAAPSRVRATDHAQPLPPSAALHSHAVPHGRTRDGAMAAEASLRHMDTRQMVKAAAALWSARVGLWMARSSPKWPQRLMA